MSIANGDFLLNQIYINDTGAKKIYKGTDLIYDRSLKNKFEYFFIYAAGQPDTPAAGSISMTNNGGNTPNLEYSRDGVTWTTWDYSSLNLDGPTTNNDSSYTYDFIFFRGYNPNGFSSSGSVYSKFNIVDNLSGGAFIKIGGNIMSLLYKDSFWKEDISPNNTIPNNYCFTNLFNSCDIYDCTGTPDYFNGSHLGEFRLPAKNLKTFCYAGMFGSCSKMVLGPRIFPATTATSSCYRSSFEKCGNLIYPPRLCATTLADYCYAGMFYQCYHLQKAPDLIAETLVNNCYRDMFAECNSVNYIKTLQTTPITNNDYTWSWVYNVSSTGTFVKRTGVTIPTVTISVPGARGIPSGWTVEEI